MSDHYLDNLLPDFGEYSLDSFLENYQKRGVSAGPAGKQEPSAAPAEPAKTAEAIARRSRQIVMEALGETLNQKRQAPELDLDGVAASRNKVDAWTEPDESARPSKKPDHRIHISDDGIITVELDIPQPPGREEPPEEEPEEPPQEYPPEEEPEPPAKTEKGKGRGAGKTNGRDANKGASPDQDAKPPRGPVYPPPEDKPRPAERFLTPLMRYFATRAVLRQMQKAEAAKWPDPVEVRETEEMNPRLANKFYARQLRPLRFRFRVCVFLCLILAWISLRLPMAGLLGASLTVQAGVSLILLMTVMVAALDILATGMRQLFDLRPGAESLASLAAILSCADAAMVVAGYGENLPFCAVGAFSLTAALWGEKLTCTARARTMRMAALSQTPSAVTAQETEHGGRYLCRTQRSAEGIVRRSEQQDFCQTAYATAAPLLLAASVLLAALASTGGQAAYFLHTLSALLTVSASFTSFLSFPLPYSLTTRKLQLSGAAIAGYTGCAEIARSKRLVISDGDLFPPGNIKFSGINILEGAAVDKVIICTASLLTASGSGAAGVFMELVTRRGYTLAEPKEFRCHEGGGLSALVNDEQVLVGSAGFMNLMGIRLPQNMVVKNAVCTALGGELVGVFTLEYVPVSSVQGALVTLLQGRTQPVFAIRDFNITPLMIRQLFRMPTDSFNFPTFRDRYRISAGADPDSPVSAVLSRPGMAPLVETVESGRKLYGACRIGTFLSLIGTIIGMVTMFLLCRAGSFDTATAGNVLSYMFLWALPVAILAFGQSR